MPKLANAEGEYRRGRVIRNQINIDDRRASTRPRLTFITLSPLTYGAPVLVRALTTRVIDATDDRSATD